MKETYTVNAIEVAMKDFIGSYNALAKIIHEDNVEKGFWPEGGRGELFDHNDSLVETVPGTRNVGEALMLIVSEVAEGMEGHRKGKKDDHLPKHESLTVELADAIIRIMDLGHGLCLPVATAMEEKLAYNRNRPFKHGKKF